MTRLTPPKATPQDIENALADNKNLYIGAAISACEELDIDVIEAAWEETAKEVRAHTPPALAIITVTPVESLADLIVSL